MDNVIYVTKGEKLKKKNEQLVIEKESEEYYLDLDMIDVIIIETPQCYISAGAHLVCSRAEVPVLICNEKHQPEVFCHSMYSYYKLTHRIKDQFTWLEKNNLSLKLKKLIIKKKIEHQRDLLFSVGTLTSTIRYINDLINELEMLNDLTDENIDKFESLAARKYFSSIFGTNFKRFAQDDINYSLNYSYSLLRSIIMSRILVKGLHPSIGLWHHNQFNNYNLSDDLIEIFRPMADYIVYKLSKNKTEFFEESKKILQNVVLQKVIISNNSLNLKSGINWYIDSVIKVFEESKIENLAIPNLRINNYEY